MATAWKLKICNTGQVNILWEVKFKEGQIGGGLPYERGGDARRKF